MRKIITIVLCAMFACINRTAAQANSMLPTDPDQIFTASNHPAVPVYNQITKWGHTNRNLGWNTYTAGYKSYYFKGMAFRLKFPKTYVPNVVDNKKFPVFIFLHGLGEPGNVWDNEFHLVHGGQLHAQAVDAGTFDGFLVYPQSQSGYLQNYAPVISDLIDSLVKLTKADRDRVILSGLSSGGQANWDILESYPKLFAYGMPISAARYEVISPMPSIITIPMWLSNGGQDIAPDTAAVNTVFRAFQNLGGQIKHSFFPTGGHGIWYNFWAEPGYFDALNSAHKANPLVYFQQNKFCPLVTPAAKLALQAGFFAYEWDKDGVTIPGATSNQYTTSTYGTYRGRFKRTSTSEWSAWSPTPVVVSVMPGTVTPPIQIDGLFSKVLPAPDGSTTVPLKVPDTYASYEWRRVSDNALVSSTNVYTAPVGVYKVKVTEQFGCTSAFGPNFSVIAAVGTNLPDKASNLTAVATSNSSVEVNWNDNPTPLFNETAFEVYRSTTAGTGYKLIKVTAADVLTYTDNGLSPKTKYYYIVRAINNNGAAVTSSEVNATTKSDVTAPTVPTNLVVTGSTRSSVSLQWTASTDDIGVARYEIYVNGVKAYTTTQTNFTVNGLTALQMYSFYVRAKDAAGNVSAASTQVSAAAALNGLSYKYYEGSWDVLPDFNDLTPVKVGTVPNISITQRLVDDNFGFLWYGYIKIPTTGTYTFETNSDDGSKLYIGQYDNAATPVVNNDGLHGTQYAAGNITLTAGLYPIAVTFFEKGGGEAMTIYWRNNVGINTRTQIPNSAFADVVTPGAVPAKPSDITVNAVSYKQINLGWTDNSNNEDGFEISRSTSPAGPYVPVATTAANVTSFQDSVGLSATTKYWYRFRAVNENGASPYAVTLQAQWGFNNNVNDGSGNGRTLTRVSSPPYSAADKKEGTHSVSFNGTSQYMDMSFSSSGGFPSNAYSTRTVAVWLKPSAATISGANKFVFDFGGADDGLALRFNSGALQAGLARNNTRTTVNINSVATSPGWINGGWNHVAVVYNVNTLKVFINGVERGSIALSGSTTVGTTSSASRIGNTNSANAFNSSSSAAFYTNLMDEMVVIDEPLNANAITALMTQNFSSDTTFALPALPTLPDGLVATAISPSMIELDWNDNSNNETAFQIERSVTNTSNFRLLAEVPGSGASQVIYTDSSLFSNTNYYYRVKAIGVGGATTFTPVVSARTLNNLPEFAPVDDFTMRYGSVKSLAISATDLDGEALSFSFDYPLPSFASFTNGPNGNGTLQFSPAIGDQGVYPISITATDGNGGSQTLYFNVTVNANYVPVIAAVAPISVNEGTNTVTAMSATDQDGNASLVFSLPAPLPFASIINNGNGSASLRLQPGFANSGVYPLSVLVSDGSGGNSTLIVNVTVNDVPPPTETWNMSMVYNSALAPAPWNNITGTSTNNLKNTTGATTTTGIDFLGTSWNAGNAGAVTGTNSGVYPDVVIRDYFWFGIYGAPETVTFNLKGLTAGAKYNVTLFGSSSWNGVPNNGTTIYTINGVAKPLNVHFNSQNTVSFNNIIPNASGNIVVNMSKAAGTPYGVLTSVVLLKTFDDGTAPVLPTNLAAEALPNGFVRLTWRDVAYNENNYLIKRSLSEAGPYTVLNPGAVNANDVSYDDNNVASNTTYYYKLESTNANGSSGETDPVSVTTINKAPVLVATTDRIMKGGTVSVINIVSTDDGSDVMTTTVTGLPTFGVYNSTGNGTGNVTFSPTVNDLGVYKNIVITVTDNNGASVSDSFDLSVTDPNIRTVYINYGPEGGTTEPAPWNNFMGYPFANNLYSNLKDDAGVTTGFGFRFLTQWTGGIYLGMSSGNNSGIFPDNVIRGSVYTTNTGNQTMQFEGLNPAMRYNFGFLNSFNSGNPNVNTYTNAAQSVSVDGKYNSTVLGNINGLTPNASGVVQITISKAAAATFVMLNAIIIQEYSPATPIVRPDNLFAETLLQTDRVQLTWSDKSSNETGFQVWRSTSLNGTYTLIQTTAANVTSYTNTGLTPNTAYYYKIRAVNGGVQSAYSNVAKILVASKIVLISLNVDAAQHAPAPWNSTDAPSVEGAVFPDLLDNTQISSGFSMVITKEFNGAGFAGVNGAGIFPPNVMVSNYWTDAGQLSQMRFINLDLRKKYRIGIFGSNANVLNATGTYTINGTSVLLNSYNNNSKVVYIDKIVPDEDGSIYLDQRTTSGSPYSFTGAFTIEYYDDNTPPNEQLRGPQQQSEELPLTQGKSVMPAVAATSDAAKANMVIADMADDISVYPNPFTNKIQVEIQSSKASNVSILLYDLNAKLVYQRTGLNTVAGKNVVGITLPGNGLTPGSYVINVLIDGKLSKSVKLIKVN